ncbi:MAG: hypothetical protein IJP29_00675 [Lachnospiraceae bacterium]|nr:hypothetical protein [Lachnospiraceae bacterium]
MDPRNCHPFNAIQGYEQLSMLESLIPFVDFSMKLPLALFIKFSEIRLIINCFQSRDNLIRLGLHNATNDPLDMIAHLTGMAPEMLKMMFSMMNEGSGGMSPDILSNLAGFSGIDFSKMDFSGMNFGNSPDANYSDNKSSNYSASNFNEFNSFGNTSHENEHDYHHDTSHETTQDTFQQNIAQILAEYDAQQKSHDEYPYSPHYCENHSHYPEDSNYYS